MFGITPLLALTQIQMYQVIMIQVWMYQPIRRWQSPKWQGVGQQGPAHQGVPLLLCFAIFCSPCLTYSGLVCDLGSRRVGRGVWVAEGGEKLFQVWSGLWVTVGLHHHILLLLLGPQKYAAPGVILGRKPPARIEILATHQTCSAASQITSGPSRGAGPHTRHQQNRSLCMPASSSRLVGLLWSLKVQELVAKSLTVNLCLTLSRNQVIDFSLLYLLLSLFLSSRRPWRGQFQSLDPFSSVFVLSLSVRPF